MEYEIQAQEIAVDIDITDNDYDKVINDMRALGYKYYWTKLQDSPRRMIIRFEIEYEHY